MLNIIRSAVQSAVPSDVPAPAASAPMPETAQPATQADADTAKRLQEASTALQAVKRQYWSPANLGAAQEAIGAIVDNASAVGMPVRYSFDTSAEFPAGYGLAVSPITRRTEQRGNVTHMILVAALPDPEESVERDERGRAFMREACIRTFITSVTNAVRPRADGSTAATVPLSLDDFLTSGKEGPSLATYRELAPGYVKALKKKGLVIITAPILRQCLTSAQFAAQQFPQIQPGEDGVDKWAGLLGKMIAKAEKLGKDPGIMLHWRDTRDEVTVDVGDFDLDGLDELDDAAA